MERVASRPWVKQAFVSFSQGLRNKKILLEALNM